MGQPAFLSVETATKSDYKNTHKIWWFYDNEVNQDLKINWPKTPETERENKIKLKYSLQIWDVKVQNKNGYIWGVLGKI